MKVDLYIDGDLGKWALSQVIQNDVGHVITNDRDIYELAGRRGFCAISGDMMGGAFEPATLGLSVHFRKIFSKSYLSQYQTIYNIHPGYLPWGRGFYPVFWALWEQTQAGASIHVVTEKLDGGPIVEQRLVKYSTSDTGFALHKRVSEEEKCLFTKWWPRLVAGELLPKSPQTGRGTYHSRKEFLLLKDGLEWESLSSQELIRLIRAMSHPDHSGLTIHLKDKQFQVMFVEQDYRNGK